MILIKIDDKFILPAEEEFWSTALQMKIKTSKDLTVKITRHSYDKVGVFGIIQNVFTLYPLAFVIGVEAATSYTDKNNGEIGFTINQLRPLK